MNYTVTVHEQNAV